MEIHQPQTSSADSRRSQTQGFLTVKTAPAGAESCIGKRLLGQTLTIPGLYTCDIDTHDWSTVEVHLKPSAATAGGTPTLARYYANKVAVRAGSADYEDVGAAFSAGTEQVLSLSNLNGAQRVRLSFTVTTSVAFADTTPATPTSVAEYNGT